MKPQLNWEVVVDWRKVSLWGISLSVASYVLIGSRSPFFRAVSWAVLFLFLNVVFVKIFARKGSK